MTSIIRLVAAVAGLVLMSTTPSWSQLTNPTPSDANRNTAGGTSALVGLDETATGGYDNTGFGYGALANTATGLFNTAIGSFALILNTGDSNTATGSSALRYNVTGNGNTATGAGALYSNTTGDGNASTGASTLYFNTTGSNNTATGSRALYLNTTGSRNAASGFEALIDNKVGDDNTAGGFRALFNNTTGSENTASGASALFTNTEGIRNTAIGHEALSLMTAGNKNIAIGFKAGAGLVIGNNNIFLGSQDGEEIEYQTMRLGKAQTRTFIAGINTATVSDAAVMIDTTTGQLGIATSSARYKQDIAPMGTRSEKVLDLQPVTFAYKDDSKGTTHYGLIAEQVATVYPELVTRTATGEVQTVKYQELIPMLLNELQHERQDRRDEVAALRQELAALRALVGGASSR